MDITKKKMDQRSVLGWSFLELGTGSISIPRRHGWHGIFNGRLQYLFISEHCTMAWSTDLVPIE